MVGLTGGIGSGKSAVAARLAELGAIIIDADQLAREAVARGTDGLAEVIAAFGPDILAADGSLNRPALGTLIFSDPAAREKLERIVHPRVRTRAAEMVAAAPEDSVVVYDVPLLVESGLGGDFDLVVVVIADEDIRVARLTRDRGMSSGEAYARMYAQASDAKRRAVADAVILNNGSLEELRDKVDALWRDRLAVDRVR